MSWRFLFCFLLLAAGASAFAGMQLGDWLVVHGPLAAPQVNPEGNDPEVLNADGKPYVAQPPQPLVDGTLGTPEAVPPVAWDGPKISLLLVNTNPHVLLSTNRMSTDELRHFIQASAQLQAGPADVVPIDEPSPGQGSASVMNREYVATSVAMTGGARDWQKTLRDELAQCAKLGFFERPSCAWGARNRHCEINHAWGAIPECPSRAMN